MRKIVSMVLIVLSLLSLTACGKSKTVIAAENAIKDIGEVTLESEEAIINAEKLLGILTDDEKANVDNRVDLVKARETFDALVFETSGQSNELSAEFVIGTWERDFSISKNANSGPAFGTIIELFKGGTGKGYLDQTMKNSNSSYRLVWEIEDDCLTVSMKADSVTIAFELDGDNIITTDGQFTYVKK